MNNDDTKPRRADVFPPDVEAENVNDSEMYDEDSGGPGCLVWGIMGIFGIVIAIAIVIAAIMAGFNAGLNTAHVTAAAVTRQIIARQCEIIPTDIAAARYTVLQDRFESMTINGVLPECARIFVPQATSAYEQSLITPTMPATDMPTASATPTQTSEATAQIASTASSSSPYDLPALLTEARDFMAASNYEDAVETLDAIRAIDPNFETQTVNGLLFNALTQQATNEFRSPNGSLAEGILLTNRAEQFGDIQALEISFERSVAEYYLDAQANLGLDYQRATSLLAQVISLSPNYPRGTGGAANQLVAQYEAWGDALLLGGDACLAESQFNNALAYRPNNPALQNKITTANQQCLFGSPATVDPNATIDPNASAAPAATPTSGVAPVGVNN